MADLGTVGFTMPSGYYIGQAVAPPYTARALIIGDRPPAPLSNWDTAFGNPSPSLHQQRAGLIRDIVWKVATGSRTVSVDCWFKAGPVDTRRPRLHVFAHTPVGIQVNLVATVADTPQTWTTITITPVVVDVAGYLEVGLELQSLDHQAECWWDNLSVS